MSEASAPSIQWFPGHMAKTRRLMQSNLRLVDIVVELRDARIPMASANPELDKLLGGKPRVILLNKSDMADDSQTKRWCSYYKEQGIPALAVDCRSGKGLKAFPGLIEQTLFKLLEHRRSKGMVGRPIRMMVVGIPNAGKSSFINRLAGNKRAKVEDRPGVTRGKQWVKVEGGMELLDMPGVLWPKFQDQTVAEHLAFTGAVKDDVLDLEGLAMRLLEALAQLYPKLVASRFKLEADDLVQDGFALLSAVGKKRGMLLPGGAINTERAAITVLDEFRAGTIGNITLEKAP